MENEIKIPVFVKQNTTEDFTSAIEPQSLAERVKNSINNTFQKIKVDHETLTSCINSIELLVQESANILKKNNIIAIDQISMNLGISSSGKVGILGSSLDISVAGSFQLIFKTENSSEKIHKEDYV